MKEILHILELLKRQAEAALATKTKRKVDALESIEQIKRNMLEMGRQYAAHAEGMVYEQWCNHQRRSQAQIQDAIPILEQDILLAFKKLETVQAKLMAAEDLAAQQERKARLEAEGVEEDAMLELSLLRRSLK
ncbi:MAG: hypothetical protein COA43_14295 [Robiginitomaculum sp.]|nr:MAG: hypothetical protein COA43_14295 [Robiginitomaculum sp.]